MTEQDGPSNGGGAQAQPPARRAPELDPIGRVGQWLAALESKAEDPVTLGAAAAFRLYVVQELGLKPLAAKELTVRHGNVIASAKLKRALVMRAGYRVERRESSDTTCTAVLVHGASGEVVGTYTYTIGMAQQARLVRKDSGWEKDPERMLWARASGRLVDDFAPGVMLGLVTEEDAFFESDESSDVIDYEDVDEGSVAETDDIPFGEDEYVTPDEMGDLEHEADTPSAA